MDLLCTVVVKSLIFLPLVVLQLDWKLPSAPSGLPFSFPSQTGWSMGKDPRDVRIQESSSTGVPGPRWVLGTTTVSRGVYFLMIPLVGCHDPLGEELMANK